MGDRLLLTAWARGALSGDGSVFEPATPVAYELGWDASGDFFVRRPSPAGPPFNPDAPNIHLLGVAFVRFHASSGVPDLALRTSSTSPIPPGEDASRWPAEPDAPPGIDRSYSRLARACALTGSGISIDRPGDQTAARVIFRLGLLDPLMITSQPLREAALSEDKVREAVTAWPALHPPKFTILGQYSSAAEMRDVAARREPYLAGCFRLGSKADLDSKADLESFASNAVGLGVLGGVDALRNQANFPGKDVPWSTISKVGDGVWWAIPWGGGNQRLTLSQALDNLGCFPDPTSPGRRPIVTLIADPDREEAAQLAVLDFLGLTASTSSAPVDLPGCEGGARVPYHHLHMRRLGGSALEWMRWVKLAPPGADMDGPAGTPALVRVSRSAPDAKLDSTIIVRVEGLTDAHILDIWSRRVAGPCRDAALRQGTAGGASLLPDLAGHTFDQGPDLAFGGPWCAEITLSEPWPDSAAPPPSNLWERYRPVGVAFYPRDRPGGPKLPFWTHAAPSAPKVDLKKGIQVGQIRLAGIRTQAPGEAAILAFKGTITAQLQISAGGLRFTVERDHRWRLQSPHSLIVSSAEVTAAIVRPGSKTTADGETSRPVVSFGGLDVEFGSGPLGECLIEIDAEPRLSHHMGRAVEQRLLLPVERVTIGGSDAGDADVADQPLIRPDQPLIRGKADQTSIEAQEWRYGGGLGCRDFVDSGGARSFTLALSPNDARTNKTSFTIVDPSPMMVAQLAATTQGRSAAANSDIATWDAADGLWRLVNETPEQSEIVITLPPQGVAEAWERSSRAAPNHLGDDQIAEGERVPARLTPVTILRIEGDERARNAVAPWNIARTLGFSADDLPGARLRSIDSIEVLYGLEGKAARIDGMRIAELSGWRGRPREPLTRVELKPAKPATGGQAEAPPSPVEQRAVLWAKGMAAWRQRLAVLDVRDERSPLDRPRISGVTYRLRSKANDGAKYVKPATAVPDNTGVADLWTEGAKGGILGGALAGFEQPSIIRTLFHDGEGRRDGIGELDGLQLSALGAWTSPRAAFDNGLTLIAAEAAMGRINEARFERKGRIGALHHLAKHVIVYRRAFLPSVQFHGEQDRHAGRPIVRKVEEYVEITQPVRTYPDRAGVWPINAGPILGARFRTVRIPVHGSWAQSLRDERVEGYSVPLWREGLDALAYPKPAIELLVAGDPQRTDPEPPARRIDNPQRLRFYTITAVGNDDPPGDVDLWPLVYGADYIDRPLDDPRQTFRRRPLTADSFGNPDAPGATLPPADLVSPGLEDFTLVLEPGVGVNLMEARNASPMIADLRSVLMMRARHQAPTLRQEGEVPAAAHYHDLAWAQRAVAGIQQKAPPNGGALEELRNNAKAALRQVTDELGGGAWITKQKMLCGWAREPAERVASARTRLAALAADLGGLWVKDRGAAMRSLLIAQTQIDAMLPLSGSVDRLLGSLIDEARAGIQEFTTLNLGALTKALKEVVEEISGWAQELTESADQAGGSLIQALRDLRTSLPAADANQALARFRTEISSAAARADEAERKITAALPQFDRAILALRDGARRVAKAAPKGSGLALGLADQMDGFRARVARETPAIGGEIRSGLGELAKALGDWSANIDQGVTEVEALLDAAERTVARNAAALQGLITGEIAALEALTIALLAELEKESGAAEKAIRDAIKDQPPLDDVDRAMRDLSTSITDLRQLAADVDAEGLLKIVSGAAGAIDSELEAVQTALETVGKDFCGFLSAASQAADELLADWVDGIRQIEAAIDAASDAQALYIQIKESVEAINLALGQLRTGIDEALDNTAIRTLLNTPAQAESLGEAAALTLLRAAGAPPIVENLLFNRDQIAYHFEERARIIVTPVTALVDQADRALRGVGLSLPTLGIDGGLLSPASSAFRELADEANDLVKGLEMKAQDVLKDFAGLKNLLPSLKFDSALADAVKVTHDFDATRQVAWLKAEIKYGPQTADLFRHDAFAIVAEKLVLDGLSLYERGLDGGERRVVKANLVSDWLLIVGGMPLIRITDAAIRYDEAEGLKFDIKPQNITFPGALQLISGLLTQLNQGGENPLQLELIADEETGKPIGLKSRYDLPPIAISAGAVAVFNAALGVHLDLVQRSEFEIRSFAYFGRRDSPFAMTVSFLGGGGYVEAEATHLPASRKTNIALRISMGLVAGTGFSFGPLRGNIQVYLGFEASFLSGAAGSRIAVAVVFVLSGSVTAWGFVTVDLGVRLQLTYDGAAMRGSGHVKVTVRISRFYKKSFSRPITYRL